MGSRIPKTRMSQAERQLRSMAARILSGGTTSQGILHGTLVERERVCGKKGCRCTRGDKHRSTYLTVRQDGKLRQIYIPKRLEATVRDWVEHDRKLRDLLEQLSTMHCRRVEDEKRKPSRKE